MGSYIGVWKRVATRAGVTLDEYLAHLDAGESWCAPCGAFHPLAAFGLDPSHPRGRRSICREAHNREQRAKYKAKVTV